MTFLPLYNSAFPIAMHAIAAIIAIILGAGQLMMTKGTALHRSVGWIWVSLIILVCLTSFFIHEIQYWGLFSPIHLLSLFTLFSIWQATNYARKGMILRHRTAMISVYFLALILTGFFTLMPGRIMHQVLFG